MRRLNLRPTEIAAFVAFQAVGLALIIAGVRDRGFDLGGVLFVVLLVEVLTILSLLLLRGIRQLFSGTPRRGP